MNLIIQSITILLLFSLVLPNCLVTCHYNLPRRVLRQYKVCTEARCSLLKSLSPLASFVNDDSLDFLHFGKWTRWSTCNRQCSTYRYRACLFPLSCGKTVIHEEAFCYHRGSHCELIYQSSLGDFYSENSDYSEYNDLDMPDTRFATAADPPPQVSLEWNNNNNLGVANQEITRRNVRRQPQRNIRLDESNRRRITGSNGARRRNRTNTNVNDEMRSRRRFYELGNTDFNGPFPIIDDIKPDFSRNPLLLPPATNQAEFTCGIPKIPEANIFQGLSRRILGGSEVQKGRWPWQVAILNRMQEAFCGGTLIAPRWILTAAHCVRRNLYVTIGEHHLQENDNTEKHYRIEAAFIHPDFETDTVDSDIALLLLPEAVSVENGLACLPYENQPLPSPNTICTILGWGKQKYNHVFGTQVLHEGKVPIVSNGECRYSYGQYEITSNMFCAGYSGGTVDSCAGDSGGPLLCTDDERWTVFGVTSFGDGCGRKFGIYAKVSNYVAWIKKVIQVNVY